MRGSVGLVEGRGPACEEVERLGGLRAGLGGVGEDGETAVSGQLQHLVGQAEVAHDRVVEVLGAGPVDAHVVRGPAGAELLAPSRELADEVRQIAVVGVPAGLRAQDGDRVVGDAVPVAVEVGRSRAEEDEPGWFTGRTGSTYNSEKRARPSAFAERMSKRPFCTRAGAPVIASISLCTLGRTRCCVRRRRRGVAGWAARARSNRCARSASSSCRARASASRTLSETPLRFPRSSRV